MEIRNMLDYIIEIELRTLTYDYVLIWLTSGIRLRKGLKSCNGRIRIYIFAAVVLK